jgi:Icc protein
MIHRRPIDPASMTAAPEAIQDGIDRRKLLKCMAWVGTGVVFTVTGGVLKSRILGPGGAMPTAAAMPGAIPDLGSLSFVQISDSHIGFDKAANHDVVATLQEAVSRINVLPATPAFMIHTGDLTHLSKAKEFDTLDEVLKSARPQRTFFVPGEHDVIGDHGRLYQSRYGKGTRGDGWYIFDHSGVHFIGLVNVLDLKAGGLGYLGADQLAWLKADLAGRSAETPIVVFAHVPLWSVYPEWGWGTDDGAEALKLLRRFGSVTVLNGHIHQTMQKIEGNITFHTARSTAFPQPAPGKAPSPGPMTVPADQLRSMLGMTSVSYVEGRQGLAIVDSTLQEAAGASAGTGATARVAISNFTFSPKVLTIRAGTTVTWTNEDDIPHTVTSSDDRFKSSDALDTGDRFALRFDKAGTYPYYCTIHPKMEGKVVVEAR